MFEDQFVPHDGIYLLNHSVGRPPVSTRKQLLDRYFEPWENGDADVWPVWLQQIESFRTVLGSLLNAQVKDLCPQTNLSSALTKIVHSLTIRPGKQKILLHEQDFPSMGFVIKRSEKLGYRVKMIPAHADPKDITTWHKFMSDDIGMVLITHVHSNSSALTPVAEITALARQLNIISIVDIAQSVGVVPIDVAAWNADFVLGSCVKWLCGGPGAAFLWVHTDRIEDCEPIDVGWFSHENPFEFDINDFRFADGALRFWGGTPSVLPYVVAANSIALIDNISVETVREHNLAITQAVIERLDPNVVVSPQEPECRGGTLVLDFGEQQTAVARRLEKANVRFDSRATGHRLSPHIYNSANELEVVMDCFNH